MGCFFSKPKDNNKNDSLIIKKCQHCDNDMPAEEFIEYYGFCETCRNDN